ncbi:MAG: squalene--hopene cyclase [Verrucomicrobia bacterium]|jgi:squalene-hopene/tetraprenyl-beta-curcumene cyclase|nr:squalene--hopene cyclase [Verrucomicrobiota bacterium]
MISNNLDVARLKRCHEKVIKDLLATRNESHYWEGHLSSSALSTATAITALALVDRGSNDPDSNTHTFQKAGIQWLVNHVNEDGGWGDTTLSLSNISTTALVWAAFQAVNGAADEHPLLMRKTESWLREKAGSLSVESLSKAIIQRYGKDKTFSVPILTMCALSGRFGKDRAAWKTVLALPFELAACPPSWYAALKLPVVSYALPALIAIGQVRHFSRPTRNPITRLLRNITRKPTLRRLLQIQPSCGGFLEATPLTSFVVMSLAGCQLTAHPVVQSGIRFLKQSMRTDGSWPIDTNLAIWVTTLGVQGLGVEGRKKLSAFEKESVQNWLLNQQYKTIHPFTLAKPGGWAWTDLPGGVPDADDTPGALIAIHSLARDPSTLKAQASMGVQWLLDLQNNDGGIPTFCKGWGKLPFDRSSADLTAHCLRAWSLWYPHMAESIQKTMEQAISRAIQFLKIQQFKEGYWLPLWFGNQHGEDDQNPIYGSSKVMEGLLSLGPPYDSAVYSLLEKGLDWMIQQQNPDGGWGGGLNTPSSNEETALGISTIAMALRHLKLSDESLQTQSAKTLQGGLDWLLPRIESGEYHTVSPIGFYFAKLWYFETMYPLVFVGSALNQIEQLLNNPTEASPPS